MRLLRSPYFLGLTFVIALAALLQSTYHSLRFDQRKVNDAIVEAQSQAKDLVKAVVKPKRTPGQPEPYYGDLPSMAAINIRDAVLDEIHAGLDYPWSMEFVDPDTLLIAEFGGSMQLLTLSDKSLKSVGNVPKPPSNKGQIGLLDIALHPKFETNRRLYFSHVIAKPGEADRFTTALSTAILEDSKLTQIKRLLVALPFAKSHSNFGGAIAFDDAGYLFFATGDRSVRKRAQNPAFLNGKILRLHDDGRIPEDNPFVGVAKTRPEIYALGVRNPQGLAYDSVTGSLYESEHGPMGGDEVNVIRRGLNYGWPTITYGANYTTDNIGVGTAADGFEQPLYYYLPSIATSPLAVYRGAMFPEWEGDLLVGALRGSHISRLDLFGNRVVSERGILDEVKGRVRDIKIASDGSIYILVQNRGRLFRLHRSEKKQDKIALSKGEYVYAGVCASCHSTGVAGAPQLQDRDEWQNRLRKGRDVLYRHSIDGFEGMPAKGLCEQCSDADIRAAVDYMLEK